MMTMCTKEKRSKLHPSQLESRLVCAFHFKDHFVLPEMT